MTDPVLDAHRYERVLKIFIGDRLGDPNGGVGKSVFLFTDGLNLLANLNSVDQPKSAFWEVISNHFFKSVMGK